MVIGFVSPALSEDEDLELEAVKVDLESYEGNPWNIFGYNAKLVNNSSKSQVGLISIDSFTLGSGYHSTYENLDNIEFQAGETYDFLRTFAYLPESIANYEKGIFGSQSVSISEQAKINSVPNQGEGNIFSNGSISVSDNAQVNGSSYAQFTTGIEAINGGVFEDNYSFNPVSIEGVMEQVSILNNNESLNEAGIVNDVELSGNDVVTFTSGVYYFESFSLEGNSEIIISGPTMIFCKGDVEIFGNCKINQNSSLKNLSIYSLYGNVKVFGDSQLKGDVFAPNGQISVYGNAKITGTLQANEIQIKGNSVVNINGTDRDKSLAFSKVSLLDIAGQTIQEELQVFKLPGKIVWKWKIELHTDGHFHK